MNNTRISDTTVKQLSLSKELTLSFKEKIEVSKLLDKLCVDILELGEIQNVKVDSLLIKSIVTAVKNSTIAVPVALGADPTVTVNALKEAKAFRLQVAAPVSPVRMEYILHKKPAALLEMVKTTIEACKKYTDDVEFIADDATRSDEVFLGDAIRAAIEAGATTVTLCEDAGNMLPEEFAAFLDKTLEQVPELKNVVWGVSCSNELAMADACVIAAVSHGAGEIKAAAYPINTASLPNVAKLIATKGEAFGARTQVATTSMSRTVAQLDRICNNGETKNVFAVQNETAEETFLSAHDTQEEVVKVAEKMGYDLSEEDANRVFEAFKRITAKKGSISSKELDAIIASDAMQVPSKYKLDSYIANTGNNITSMVHVCLVDGAELKEGISLGDGPIDAAFLAIEQITGKHFELDDFQIRSVTEGKEAAGETVVKLRSKGKVYSGRGLSTDIIGASIRAYLNALNKVVYEEDEQ